MEGEFFSGYDKKMRKGRLFKMVRNSFEKQVSKVRKKWKTNAWKLESAEKMAKLYIYIYF